MGLNTSLVLLNDHLPEIMRHPELWARSVFDRIQLREFNGQEKYGTIVVACEHSSQVQLVAAGGNRGNLIATYFEQALPSMGQEKRDLELIKGVAYNKGYYLRRRSK